ncbi:phage recombination protein Bet [Streptomyces aurantiogriseus]|uniref:phage recombination protein Bet n=1 Tax=Streptomyces aurantiogriseus TaxID=66870 RepID=UPI0016791378|nr:phage recombination protein Bet [Streptomyces aurantiogriseus]
MADAPVTWLAIREDQKAFEDQQLRALRAAFPDLAEASPAQLGIFFHYCKASGLDPFGRQIYMIRRKSRGETRWTIQTGIDGYRLIARRAADRAGQSIAYEDFVWYDAEGGEHTVWLRDEPPAACRVVVWRGDSRFPAVAHWREYAPKVWDYEAQEYKLGGLWPQMPASQLSKVAEALALRRACPADLSGLHVDEEMHAADAAESRERVQAAAARLKHETTGQPDKSQPAGEASSPGDTVEAEVVENRNDDETSSTALAGENETPSPADPHAELDRARREVQRLADHVGMAFDTVNERCFDDFGVSYQDASAEQLRTLLGSLRPDGETGGHASADADPSAEAPPTRRRAPAKKATPRKAAAKKTASRKNAAKKASPRGSSPSQADATTAQ